MTSAVDLDRLFKPRSIAIYGGRWSDTVAEQCLKLGYPGDIWCVHPNRSGYFNSTDVLPGVPDSVFFGINREATVSEFEVQAARGIGGAVIFASGFGETADGADYRDRLHMVSGDIPFIGPNCYGFVNFFDRVSMWPDQVVGQAVERGVAIITQSGTIALTLMYQQRSLDIGFVVTLGNQQRLTSADLIRYLADDPRVSAIGLYLEGINDVAGFTDAIEHAQDRSTPVAIVKAGRSEKSRRVALTHTGAMTGSDTLYDTLFDRLGVARCETLDQLLETLKLLHCIGPLKSRKLFVAGASGGDMAMVCDNARHLDIEFSDPSSAQSEALKASTGPRVAIANPLDFGTATWFDSERMQAMFGALMQDESALCAFVLDPPPAGEADLSTWLMPIDAMLTASRTTGNPAVLISSLAESLSVEIRNRCLDAGVAPMQGLASFLQAFAHGAQVGERWQNWQPPVLTGSTESPSCALVRMNEPDSKTLLMSAGLKVPRGQTSSINDAGNVFNQLAGIGGRVVIKAVMEDVSHKSDVNGVVLNITTPDAALAAARSMDRLTDTVLIEEMIDDAVAELIVGIGHDADFGHFISFGAGGIHAELLNDRIAMLLPLKRSNVERALSRLKVSRLLDGWRGALPGDRQAVINTIMTLPVIIDIPGLRLAELDINPLMVRPNGKGTVCADALITIREN
ncbi:MAG: acyl-CoA synthetase [marine bacterium B5-7]|nr:MAG: acyl-CoA synthetase [marine bacterium B5-7]